MDITPVPAKAKIKNFWNAHKTKILIGTTIASTAIATLQQIGLRQHDEFLKERGLYDEFYTSEEDEEN